MKADCHIHMLLDGQDWRRAIDGHRSQPDRDLIRCRLRQYAEEGFTYLRDGGDRWGVGAAAREIAPEFGITYRTPLSPLCRAGHYGAFIGKKFENLKGYARLVGETRQRGGDFIKIMISRTPLSPLCRAGHYGAFIGKKFENLKGYARLVGETRQRGGDFIKIMISGLMDFDRCGVLTEEGLAPDVIAEMIHIAHEEGFAVMAHANGARTIEAAACAGVESIEHGAYQDDASMQAMAENATVWCPTLSAIEHGAYQDDASMQAMAENATVWCPTLSAIGNLRGKGRFDEEQVEQIYTGAVENVRRFVQMGGIVAPGSDAGAWAVPHVSGSGDEYRHLEYALGEGADPALLRGVRTIRDKF